MRFLPTCIVLFAASATVPLLGQSSTIQHNAQSNLVSTAGSSHAPAAAPTPDAAALRSDIDQQDRVIKNQIDAQQNLLKKNKEMMKQARKLDEKNKKLAEKNRKLEAQNRAFNAEKNALNAKNAALAQEHEDLKAAEKPITIAPVK